MTRVRVHNFAISIDGFATGEGQARDAPFGHAGERLHTWMFDTEFIGEGPGGSGVDSVLARAHNDGIGVEIMGRGKFRPESGEVTDVGTATEWRGWWGSNPPFHTPVFVLTHHPRPTLEMDGGTTFHFVDVDIHEALALATDAAGDLDVRIGGGPTVVRDFLAAGLVDLAHIVVVPILLGRGVRLWDGLEGLEDQYDIETVASPAGLTHLTLLRR